MNIVEIIMALTISFLLGLLIGLVEGSEFIKKEAIDRGYMEYNETTGVEEWVEGLK